MKKMKLHIEVMRIIAAYFVIFNHTGDSGFSLFMQYESNSLQYWLYMLVSVICKISVPIFFMISGALLLQKQEEGLLEIGKRFFRILMVLIVFSLFSYFQQIYFGNEVFDIKHFIRVLIENDWMNPYWYLYAFLAYIIVLPFLRALAQKLEMQHYLYLIVLQVLFIGVIPIVSYYFGNNEYHVNYNFSVGWLIGNVPFYPLLGYFLENKLEVDRVSKKHLIGLWAVNVFCIILTCYMTYYNNVLTGVFAQMFLMSLTSVNCITFYVSMRKWFAKISRDKWASKLIVSLGRATFGIYLVHGLLLREPRISIWNKVISNITINPMISCLIRCAEVFVIGYLITLALKRVPLIKKLV